MRTALGALEAEIATELMRRGPSAVWYSDRRFNEGVPPNEFSMARDIVRRWSEKWLETAEVCSSLDKRMALMSRNAADYRIAYDEMAARKLGNFIATDGQKLGVVQWEDRGEQDGAYVTVMRASLLRLSSR